MEDQQRLAQIFQTLLELLFCNIIEKFAFNAEWPAGELNLYLTLVPDRFDLFSEQAGDVRGIVGCGNCNERTRFRNPMRCSEDGGATQAMADQDCKRAILSAQMICCCDQILDVRGEMRIGKLAFAHAETGEIEAQHADSGYCQPFGNSFGCKVILAAGKTVRK